MGHLYQMSVEFIQSMTLGSIYRNSLFGQEGRCEVRSVGRTGLGFDVMWQAGDIGRSRRMVCGVGLLHAEVSPGSITTALHSVLSKFILH